MNVRILHAVHAFRGEFGYFLAIIIIKKCACAGEAWVLAHSLNPRTRRPCRPPPLGQPPCPFGQTRLHVAAAFYDSKNNVHEVLKKVTVADEI